MKKTNTEKWVVFYYGEKELCAYTVRGTFEGEQEATKESLAAEYGIDTDDIKVVLEVR